MVKYQGVKVLHLLARSRQKCHFKILFAQNCLALTTTILTSTPLSGGYLQPYLLHHYVISALNMNIYSLSKILPTPLMIMQSHHFSHNLIVQPYHPIKLCLIFISLAPYLCQLALAAPLPNIIG